MLHTASRRKFLQATAAMSALAAIPRPSAIAAEPASPAMPFRISLAQWSLHRALQAKDSEITNLDFPAIARQKYGIEAIEYVNQFFKDKARDESYLGQLKQRCDDHGVKSLLIMVDREGNLGDADTAKRTEAVNRHHQWVDAAKFLGCHSIRVNAASSGTYLEQLDYAADGLRRLSEYAATQQIGVIVENHGGLSSNAAWLAVVMERVGMENCGTLPDFGNFYITRGENPDLFDRYHGVQALMPYAKAVSAKTHDFDADGNEVNTDYEKMMKIVLDFGYNGYVGIEYEGSQLSEDEGIMASKRLLERVGAKLA